MKRVSLSLTPLVLLIGSVVPGCNGGSDDNGGGNGYVPPPAAEFKVNSLQVTPDEVPTGNTATIKANTFKSFGSGYDRGIASVICRFITTILLTR
jgi:hypothetical protein